VAELRRLLAELNADPSVRVVVVTGVGDRVFCAGADLKERAAMSQADVEVFLGDLRALMDGLASMACPTIAAINGAAMGGGLELALACDMRVASSSAVMALPETSLAIIPGAGGTQRLPRLIGVARAKELIFSARRVDAQEAARIGLVNTVVAPDELMQKAHEIATQIAANGPLAVRLAKQALDGGIALELPQALDLERRCYTPTLQTEDRVEALRAFAEKRPAQFRAC
jgi:enoyl-CoA hydratase/carnithine racemase